MNCTKTILAAFLLMLLPPAILLGQETESEWGFLMQQSEELYRQGDYNRAILPARRALEIAERELGPDHPEVAKSLYSLAKLYEAKGAYRT